MEFGSSLPMKGLLVIRESEDHVQGLNVSSRESMYAKNCG
jgi:hypothetical protein